LRRAAAGVFRIAVSASYTPSKMRTNKMKQAIALVVMVAMLATVAPADAAECLKGAAVGALAGHLAHHTVLGALGGCIVGHEAAKSRTTITYADIGTMLGDGSAPADWSRITAASKINVVKVSSLKGFVAHDAKMQAAISTSAEVRTLDAQIATNANLSARLKGARSVPADVIAAVTDTAGSATLFIDK
jgi:hypothetical protein